MPKKALFIWEHQKNKKYKLSGGAFAKGISVFLLERTIKTVISDRQSVYGKNCLLKSFVMSRTDETSYIFATPKAYFTVTLKNYEIFLNNKQND